MRKLQGRPGRRASLTRMVACALMIWASATISANSQVPPPDSAWMADAVVEKCSKVTDTKLGAAQGVAIRDGRIYAYGDVYSVNPRVGVIREYDLDLKQTGREVWLRKGDRPLIIHPTGLTWNDRWGIFLGDTIKATKKAVIYRLDWTRAWSEGNLDHAVLDVIDDDAAINGCRPTFVQIGEKSLIATADYGDVHPEIRLYDPELLLKAHRSSAPALSSTAYCAGLSIKTCTGMTAPAA